MAAFCFAQMQEHFLMPNLCPSWISLCLLPVQPHKCWHCPGPSSRLLRSSLLLHTDGDLNHLTLQHFQLMTQLNYLPGFSSGVYDWGWEGMHWSTYYWTLHACSMSAILICVHGQAAYAVPVQLSGTHCVQEEGSGTMRTMSKTGKNVGLLI